MGMKDSVTNKATGIAGRVKAPTTHELRKRVAALEAEVQECRQLNLRLAELTDLVTDLVVPLARGDQEAARAALAKYHESI